MLPLPDREERWVRRLFERALGGFYDVVLSPQGWQVAAGRALAWQIEWGVPASTESCQTCGPTLFSISPLRIAGSPSTLPRRPGAGMPSAGGGGRVARRSGSADEGRRAALGLSRGQRRGHRPETGQGRCRGGARGGRDAGIRARGAGLPPLVQHLSALRVSVLAFAGRAAEAERAWRLEDLPEAPEGCLDLGGQIWREMEALSCAAL